jgi:hypothetical protein
VAAFIAPLKNLPQYRLAPGCTEVGGVVPTKLPELGIWKITSNFKTKGILKLFDIAILSKDFQTFATLEFYTINSS